MRALFLAAALSFVGCQKSAETEVAVAPASGTPSAVTVTKPAGEAKPAAPTPKLTSNPDGTLRLEFVDRWGAKFDATYESFTYLERALPTVSRALEEAQVAQLKQAVEAQRPH